MILVLCGKSASGKDTILGKMKEEYGLKPIVSTTSRPMREGEKDGVDYYYKTREEFIDLIRDDKLIEYRSYDTMVSGKKDTWYYGVEKMDLSKGDYVTVLDLNGLESFKREYGDEIVACYVGADEKTREQRAMSRGSFDKTEWDRRVKADNIDFPRRRVESLVDKIAYNGRDSSVGELSREIHDFFLEEKEKRAQREDNLQI